MTLSFLLMFYILDSIYPFCKEDDIGGLLSIMSPEFFLDGMPADLSVLERWNDYCEKHSWDVDSVLSTICGFLREYQEEYGFDYSITISYIENNPNAIDVVGAYIRAEELLKKYIDH